MRITRAASAPLLLGVALVTLALYHVLLTGSTLLAFGLDYPFMDQLRENFRLLTVPFPDNVLALANGHRPVLPALVRVIELKWLHGRPVLQLVTAWLAAGAVAVWLLACVAREFRSRWLVVSTACCAVCTLLLWNGYARMFIQAFEAVHVFYVLAFLTLALHYATHTPDDRVSWVLALVACVAASFSFGAGIACFVAVLAVALARRAAAAVIVATVTAAMTTFAVYYFVLPGAEDVRESVASLSIRASILFTAARVGAIAGEFVRPYHADLGAQILVSSVIGGTLLTVLGYAVIRQYLQREPFSRIALIGVGLATFGATVDALIAQTRMAYFFDHPDQLLADRYLPWSGVTWLGAVFFALPRMQFSGQRLVYGGAAAMVLLSALAVPSALWWNTWSAEVHRKTEFATMAARLGLRDNAYIAAVSEMKAEDTYHALDEMRSRHLGMFANPSWQVGASVPVPASAHLPVTRLTRIADGISEPLATLFEGRLPRSLAASERHSDLWFADAHGMLIGLATLIITIDKRRALRLGVPVAVGLQGYIVGTYTPDFLVAIGADDVPRVIARVRPAE